MNKPETKTQSIILLFIPLFLLGAQGHGESMSSLLLALVILLPSAKLAGMAAERLGQPAVMGELLAGMLLGNLGLAGLHGLEYLKTDAAVEILASLFRVSLASKTLKIPLYGKKFHVNEASVARGSSCFARGPMARRHGMFSLQSGVQSAMRV